MRPDYRLKNSHCRIAIEKPYWAKTQRKIKRLYLKCQIDDDHCFTLSMLQAIKAVRRSKGMRPEDQYRHDVGQTRQRVSISSALPLKQH